MLAHLEIVAILLAFIAASTIAAPTMRIPADELVRREEAQKGGEFGDEPYVRVDTAKPLVKRTCSPRGRGGAGTSPVRSDSVSSTGSTGGSGSGGAGPGGGRGGSPPSGGRGGGPPSGGRGGRGRGRGRGG